MLELTRGEGLGKRGQSGWRVHEDRAAAFLHFFQHGVVAQAGRDNGGGVVRREVFQHFSVLDHVILAKTVGGF